MYIVHARYHDKNDLQLELLLLKVNDDDALIFPLTRGPCYIAVLEKTRKPDASQRFTIDAIVVDNEVEP